MASMEEARRDLGLPRGLATINAAVLLFGLAGVLGKMADLPSPLIVLARVLIGGAALAVIACLFRIPLRPNRPRDLAVLAGQGALLAIHWIAFFQAINVSSVAVGLLAFSSFPLFTAALEPLLLRQRLRPLELAGALLVLPGIFLLIPTLALSDSTTQGVAWGVLSGATFALLSVTNRALTRSYSSLAISLYQDATAAIVLLPALWLIPSGGPLSARQIVILLALGLACTALAHTLFITGMRAVRAQLASLLASLEPIWGILFALVLLGERPSARTLLGGAIILCATLIPAAAALLRDQPPPPV